MTLQTITFAVESSLGVRLNHRLLAQEGGSDRLLILLPGRGYTLDYPLFYNLRRAALGLGWDVLNVQYGFQAAGVELEAAQTPQLIEEVMDGVRPALERGYKQVCVAGKSLGTPMAAEVARSIQDAEVSLILLTPIGGAVQGLGSIPTLALVGTADALYSAHEVQAFTGHPTVTWRVYEGLNHSLEVKGDWRASLRILETIIDTCESFLKSPHESL